MKLGTLTLSDPVMKIRFAMLYSTRRSTCPDLSLSRRNLRRSWYCTTEHTVADFTGQVIFWVVLPTFFTSKNGLKKCNLFALLNSSETHKMNCGNRLHFFAVFQANLLNKDDILAISMGRFAEKKVIFDRKRRI